MASPEMLKPPKRIKAENFVRKGFKWIRQYLSPPNIEDTIAPPASVRAPSQSSSLIPGPSPGIPTQGGSSHQMSAAPQGRPAEPLDSIPTIDSSDATAQTRSAGGFKAVATHGLELALLALRTSSDIVPSLKPVIGEVIGCLDTVQAASANDEEYKELTSEFATMANTLKEYLGEASTGDKYTDTACQFILQSIAMELTHLKKRQGRSKFRRVLESTEDRGDIMTRYHRVEGLFRQLHNCINLQALKTSSSQRMGVLLQSMLPADDALYDSRHATTTKRRGCTAETRMHVREQLQRWARDPSGAKTYWMNGMAGTGKTTIAYSLCEWLQQHHQLGASFFCSRASALCRNVNSIIPSIAHQLAYYSLPFRSALCDALEYDSNATKRHVAKQFEALVQVPMEACKNAIPSGVVVVIDALDECEDDYGVRQILEVLLRIGSTLPVKFFIASRPESAIRDNMLGPSNYPPHVLHLHDIDQLMVEEDIKRYLGEAFKPMSPPPSDEQLEQLAKQAGKLFIYAATVVRYILPGRGPSNPTVRLNTILKSGWSHGTERPTKMYKRLDELYADVLSAAFNDEDAEDGELKAMRAVLWTVICAGEPISASAMATFLSIPDQQILSALQPLLSVVYITEGDGLVSIFHASFPEYMLDHSRSGDFYCDQAGHNEVLANRCFDLMGERLSPDMCGFQPLYVPGGDVLAEQVEASISPALLYACAQWGRHLQATPPSPSAALFARTLVFLRDQRQLVFWILMLNMREITWSGLEILNQVKAWVASTTPKDPMEILRLGELDQLLYEAQEFVASFATGDCQAGAAASAFHFRHYISGGASSSTATFFGES